MKQIILYDNYDKWVSRYDTLTDDDRINIKQRIEQLEFRPLISIVTPVYNTPVKILDKAIWSVRRQLYSNWELCIADDKSPNQEVKDLLLRHAEQDNRIKLVFRDTNGHISLASNSALELATGEFVGLLDHDDMLPEHALYYVAQAINDNPDVQLLYSDEDKIDKQDRRFTPHFKSDWNPDLFFTNNYFCHFGIYRRDLLTKVGGFRTGVEGSQDYDLVLRCLCHVQSCQITHIPRVLYHWRALDGSAAKGPEEKDYTTEAGLKALCDYFVSLGRNDCAIEKGPLPNTYRVHYPVPTPAPLVSLVIPTRDRLGLLEPCVRSILDKTTYTNYEILIIDNQSVEPETLKFFSRLQEEESRVRVLPYNHPFNYAAINNFGVNHANGEIIGLINNDTQVISPDWLTEMVSHACRPEIGCVGAKLYFGSDTVQHAGVITGLWGGAGHSHRGFPRRAYGYFARLVVAQNLSAVTAACLLVRRKIYEQAGGFNEHNLTVAFNDVDFCLRVREAGYRNLWTPYAELYHYESETRGYDYTPEKRERFCAEINYMKAVWGDKLLNDPFYNPNLTLERDDFSLAWPPRVKLC
jgi:GT2 family glycosyltransferase